ARTFRARRSSRGSQTAIKTCGAASMRDRGVRLRGQRLPRPPSITTALEKSRPITRSRFSIPGDARMSLQCAARMIVVLFGVFAAFSAVAQSPNAAGTSLEGFYMPEQAVRGASVYQKQCSVCHGSALGGGGGPAVGGGAGAALVGTTFWKDWGGRDIGKLWYFVHSRMPLTAPGELPAQDSIDILAFILGRKG